MNTPRFSPALPRQKCLSIAVTGHRRNQLDAKECERIETMFSVIFQEIACTNDGPHRLVTGMADGADLAAVRACPAGWDILGILALPVQAWATGLAQVSTTDAASFAAVATDHRIEILPPPRPNYSAVGRRILEGADALIGVWNGKPGHPGGTAEVIDSARRAAMPIAVINV